MMNCKQVTNLLSQYMEGDLSPRDASQVQSHILACRSCADALEKLTKAIETLESMPKDEPQVDLYNAFRSRLERSSKKRRPTFVLPPMRRWAVAGLALVLLFGGSLIGGWYQHSRTLYVSSPRSGQSILDSSVAIAADASLRRQEADKLLFADPRLSGRIDVTARGENLRKVIGTIADRCGVPITVSTEIERQRVYLRLGNMPAAQALSEIRRLFDLDWLVSDGGYELICSRQVSEMSAAVAEAQAWAQAEQTLRNLKSAIDMRSSGPLAGDPLTGWNGLANEIDALGKDPAHKLNHEVLPLFMLDGQAVSIVLAGRKYERSYEEMSDAQKHYIREWWQSRWNPDGDRVPPNTDLTMRMHRDDDGGVTLSIMISYASGSDGVGIGLFDPVWGRRNTNLLSTDDLRLLYNEARLGNPNYDNSALDLRLGNRKGAYTLRQTLDLLVDRTNLQIVADYYTVDRDQNRILPRELSLGEMLAVLDKEYSIAWRLEGSTLYLIHRQWPMLRDTEPSEDYVGKLNASIRRNGRLSLLELAELADVSEPQLRGMEEGLDDLMLRQNLRNVVWNMRGFLKAYASLTPEQRRMAESKDGLPSSGMTDRQKLRMVEAAYGSPQSKDFDVQRVEPFTFRVRQFESTHNQVDQMLNDGRMGATVISPGDAGPDARQEFVMFELSGRLEDTGVFNWPQDLKR